MRGLLILLLLPCSWGALAGVDAGLRAHQRGGSATTMREWLPRAEAGDANAQYNLGVIYDQGKGVPEDDAEAAKWFRLAADQGDAMAQFNLGLMYSNGEGVEQDFAEAVKWYGMAAEQGDARAQVHLGLLYAQGKGVRQDYVRTYAWWSLAAAQGVAKAAQNQAIVRERMTPAQIEQAQLLSRELCAKIANCVR